jgi:hypothetical protein
VNRRGRRLRGVSADQFVKMLREPVFRVVEHPAVAVVVAERPDCAFQRGPVPILQIGDDTVVIP